MQLIKPDININFIGIRKIAFIVSIIAVLISFASLIYHKGPRYGVDFEGGLSIQIKLSGQVKLDDIHKAVGSLGIDNVSIQQFGRASDNEFQIRSPLSVMKTDLADQLKKSLEEITGVGVIDVSIDMVGPQASKDLREKALLAIFFALLLLEIYISGRFELKWTLSALMAAAIGIPVYFIMQLGLGMGLTFIILLALGISLVFCWYLKLKYALGAIIALVHDLIITVGIFSLLNIEFTLQIVAALLTIIGYSLNDTIIIFDRIRENIAKDTKQPLPQIINRSINETLSRTVITSLLTLFVVLALFLLGGSVIHHFALAMIIGIVVGTYSSIYIASPVLIGWKDKTN